MKDRGQLSERERNKHLVKVDGVIKFVALVQMYIEIWVFGLAADEGDLSLIDC